MIICFMNLLTSIVHGGWATQRCSSTRHVLDPPSSLNQVVTLYKYDGEPLDYNHLRHTKRRQLTSLPTLKTFIRMSDVVCGGFTKTEPATEEIQKICDEVSFSSHSHLTSFIQNSLLWFSVWIYIIFYLFINRWKAKWIRGMRYSLLFYTGAK